MSSLLHPLETGFGFGGYIPRCLDASLEPDSHRQADDEDRYWMRKALLQAMEATGRSSPNPAVGAVFVRDGQLLAQGSTLVYGDKHAERAAIESLVDPEILRGSTCYVTLEPCAAQGKQPPCTEALLRVGIRRCVIGAQDPHPKAAGQALQQLSQAGIELVTGVMAEECQAFLFPFLAYQSLQRPVVIGKWAQTLDGQLADDQGRSQWISGPKARAYTHSLRQKYDAIMVGVGTVLADAPSLTVRDSALPRNRQPSKIIFDPRARLSTARPEIFAKLREGLHPGRAALFYVTESPAALKAEWIQDFSGVFVGLAQSAESTRLELLLQLDRSYRQYFGRELQSILLEGGAQLLTLFMRDQLLDAIQVFVRAGILGGSRHRIGRLDARQGDRDSPFNPSLELNARHDFQLVSSLQLEDDIVLECVHRRFDFWSR